MSKGRDEFGDRMKRYEMIEAGRRFLPLLPVVARLDGRAFSSWTQGLGQPFDMRFTDLMVRVTKELVNHTQACIGYTQSDEISLAWYSPNYDSQIFFDGRIMKMTSVLASVTTYYFNEHKRQYLATDINQVVTPAFFDCRVWQLPTLEEATNAILWREQDATKNSVSSAARCYYSPNQLHGQGRADMMDMLHRAGVNWNDYPVYFKRGTYIQKRKVFRKFTPEEISCLPLRHAARQNPDMEIQRTEVSKIDMPPLAKVTNRVGVIFEGADPITEGDW
jgi:tRNA(His) guanylyltransferase